MKDHSTPHRFFAEDLSGEAVELGQAEARHAARVLRLSAGAQVKLFDGAGTVAAATLEKLTRRSAVARIVQRRKIPARPEPVVRLGFSVPKGRRLDWLLEKATELGAARLSPVVFERSVNIPKMSGHARSRWRAICIAAAKQCRADFLPEIDPASALSDFLGAEAGGVRILGDADSDVSVPTALEEWSPGSPVTILVGPEGGPTDAERRAALAAGFSPVRLGEYVLRVETAALVLLAGANMFCRGCKRPQGKPAFTSPQE